MIEITSFLLEYSKTLDHVGFTLAGIGTFGALAVPALTKQELLFGNDEKTLLAITNNLRPWWLKSDIKKNFALLLLDKGIPWFLLLAFIGFMLQIPQRFT